MPSMFNASDADSYDRMMGRWSRRLAPLFIEHAGAGSGERLLEVGCGTGSLTFTLARSVAAFACKVGVLPIPKTMIAAAMDSLPADSVTTILEGTRAECGRRIASRLAGGQ